MIARFPLRAPALVFGGGALGTVGRFGIDEAMGVAVWPWSTLGVNVVGSFALAMLITRSLDPTSDLRLFAGTGLLGSFTTYSALAAQGDALLRTHAVAGLAYVGFSVVAGLAAAFLGLTVGQRKHTNP